MPMAVDVVVGHLGYMKTDKGINNKGFQEFLNLVRDGKTWGKTNRELPDNYER